MSGMVFFCVKLCMEVLKLRLSLSVVNGDLYAIHTNDFMSGL